MNIEIKPLAPELADDFFDFFDNRAFSDHAEWSCCYCTFFHVDKALEECIEDKIKADKSEGTLRRILKNTAAEFINENTLCGYLAYADGVPVGWCNANDKKTFSRLDYNEQKSAFICESGSEKIKSVVCFTVAPEYRGKGIATALLKSVVADAASEGYDAVEAYPRLRDNRDIFDYNGPVRLYEKAGFTEFARQDNIIIMRKELNKI